MLQQFNGPGDTLWIRLLYEKLYVFCESKPEDKISCWIMGSCQWKY